MANLLREGRRTPPRPLGAQVAERQERRFEPEALIGRERPFSVLYDAWLDARRRVPRVVVLTGDPGIGKTTLANAFVSSCQMDGAVVARVQGYDAERDLPFAVLGELVRQLIAQRAVGSAEPEALSELGRIAPEVFAAFPGVPKPVDWAAEVMPLRLADGFLKAITAAGDDSPVVLVVDDVHAADNASVAILHSVARKLGPARLLLILAGRSSDVPTSAASAALTADTALPGLGHIELDGLAADAAERLVRRVVAGAESVPAHGAAPIDRILRAGSGNPLALELLTREWVAHGPESLLRDLEALDRLPAPTLGIPRAIRTVFERQTRRLDPRTRRVLDLAAVLGRRLGDLSLYAAVETPPGAAAAALSRLRDEGILREVLGDLEFRNELIRAQAYYAVAGVARQHLHRRVAELLGERPPAARQPLEIAWHFLQGGEPARSVPFALEGSEEALRVGAPYEAEQILTALLRERTGGDRHGRIHLLAAKALLDQSKAEAAIPVLDTLLDSVTMSPRHFAEAAGMRASAEYILDRGAGGEYADAADRALNAAQRTGDLGLVARALFECARAGAESGTEGRVAAAMANLRELECSERLANDPGLLHALGFCHWFFFDLEIAAGYLDRAVTLLRTSSNSVALNYALNGYGLSKQYSCEFGAAATAFLESLSLAERIGDDSRVSLIASNLCSLRCLEGEYDSAVEFGRRSVDVGLKRIGHPCAPASYTNLAEAYMLSGEKVKAFACLESARALVAVRHSWRVHVAFLSESANLALLVGNVGLAIDSIGLLEEILGARGRAAPNLGQVQKLQIFRAAHVTGAVIAHAMAVKATETFLGKNVLCYLDALGARAWTERLLNGAVDKDTEAALSVFERRDLAGKRAALVGQGFLAPTDGQGTRLTGD
jgi:tetratricopeptide (TPR) repeat protein